MSSPPHERSRTHTPREAAVSIARRLIGAGHIAFFAGGCVRDRLMGRPPKDYDIATDARPEDVHRLFRRAQSVGESFGVVLVRRLGHTIEVATFRTDGEYSDSRHPDEVVFSDAEHDARRRDFTINGLFENPLTGEIIDHVGGQADIHAGLIRAIGDPEKRLREDHLRTLRAVRFAARFGFAIEAATAEAITAAAGELRGISRERIGQEVRWMLTDPNRAVAAWEMQYLGLDEVVLEEPHTSAAPKRVGQLPDHAAYPTVLAAWQLDRQGGQGCDLAATGRRWTAALMLSNVEQRAMRRCVEIHAVLKESWPHLGVAGRKRLAALPDFNAALLILKTEDRQAFADVSRQVARLAETALAPPPLITGDDLIGEGYPPGPEFKRVLERVYDAQLEGEVTTRDQALWRARALMRPGADDGPPGP